MMKRMACFCLLAAALLVAGCTGPTYYGGLTDQRDPKAQSIYRDGLALLGTHEYRSAIETMKKAVEADPNITEAYLGLSRSCFAVGDYDMALYYNVKYTEQLDLRERVYYFQLR
jgi:tetratricopeptide (TPR) repeat protein